MDEWMDIWIGRWGSFPDSLGRRRKESWWLSRCSKSPIQVLQICHFPGHLPCPNFLRTALFKEHLGEVVEKVTLGDRKAEFFFYNICCALGNLWAIQKLSKCKIPSVRLSWWYLSCLPCMVLWGSNIIMAMDNALQPGTPHTRPCFVKYYWDHSSFLIPFYRHHEAHLWLIQSIVPGDFMLLKETE